MRAVALVRDLGELGGGGEAASFKSCSLLENCKLPLSIYSQKKHHERDFLRNFFELSKQMAVMKCDLRIILSSVLLS